LWKGLTLGKNKTIFKKPDLIKDGFFADMHFHSNLGEGYLTSRQIIDRITSQGINLAITDHNLAKGAISLSRKSGMIIPGIECITSDGFHFIIYFKKGGDLELFYNRHIQKKIDQKVKTYLTLQLQELIDLSKNYDCITCLPHPYTYFNESKHNIIEKHIGKDVDCIETLNGFLTHRFNKRAAYFSMKANVAATGGTDGRTLEEIGNVATFAETHNIEGFFEAIHKGKTYVYGKETPIVGKIKNILYRPEMHPKFWPMYINRRIKIAFNRL